MNRRVLYKKEMELLNLAKEYIAKGDSQGYISNVRDAFPDLFYENSFNLKDEFIELIPSENLAKVRNLLEFLKVICGYSVYGFTASGQITYHKPDDLTKQITSLLNLMQNQLNLNAHYKVFYSWQSDLDDKYNRNFIETSIKKVIKQLNAESLIKLTFDKDTRGETGSPDIIKSILDKIDDAMLFICDVTLIDKLSNMKGVVNSNIMFELGYAISSLSDERVIMVCNTAYGNMKELPFDLGLKRQICYNYSLATSLDERKIMQERFESSLKEGIKNIRDKKW